MHDSPTIPPHGHLLSLLAHWEHEKEKGNILTPETLCKDYPELLVEIREKLKQLKQSPLNTVDSEAPTIAPSSGSDTEPNTTTSTPSVLPNIPGFHIESELGRGGMGVVYLARQIRLNRPVALKMIISGEHASADTRLRFLAEAEAIAKLHHPGIVQVHEFGTHDNNPFFALEYVPGGSLDKKLAGTPLPPKEAANLVEKLAHAVQAAHDQGIIHRDLKPANILLGSPLSTQDSAPRTLSPKITDFGLVKKAGSDMTATGQILGTPSYMAPEQADGKKAIGPAVDIYALGAILYECLTGRPPFKAATPLDTILQVVNDEPVSIRQLQPKTPLDVETICLKCLQKDPGKRYATATELAEDLGRYLRGETIAARPVGRATKAWRWCKRYPAVAALLLLSVLGALAALATSIYVSSINSDLTSSNQSLDAALKDVKEKEGIANQRAKETRLELERFQVGIGFPLVANGDFWGGMLWFAQPLMWQDHSKEQELYLERIASYWKWAKHQTLVQHSVIDTSVERATFSQDGSRIVTINKDLKSQVWDAINGKPLSPPFPHHGWGVVQANFSPNGLQVVTVSGDETARVWDAATGKLAQSVSHKNTVNWASFSPDGRKLVTTSDDKTAIVWDAVSGKPAPSPLQHNDKVYRALFSPDSRLIVTTCGDNTAKVWDSATGLAVTPSLSHQDHVTNACFSSDSRRIVTASLDGSAQVWDVTTGASITPLLKHSRLIRSATFSPDGRRVVTASYDSTARVWDALTGQPITPFLTHNDPVQSASFSGDGRRVVTASDDKTARVWDASSGQQLALPLTHQGKVIEACFSADGRRIVTISNDSTVRMWDVATGLAIPLTIPHTLDLTYAGFSQDSHRVATASKDKTARIWNATTGEAITPPLKHSEVVSHVSFSPDGRYVLTASADKTAKVWDAVTGQPLPFILQHKGAVNRGEFSPDSRLILTVSVDNARVWNATTGEMLAQPLTHNGAQIIHASFSPNGRHVVTTSSDKTAIIWDTTTGKRLFSPLQHSNYVNHASFNPDGSRVVTVSRDMTARVWDAKTGEAISPFMNHLGNVNYARFSSDGQRVVTASDDKTARVWDANSGKPLAPPMFHQGAVFHARFSEDGRRVIAASGAMVVLKWDAATAQPISPALNVSGGVTHEGISLDGQRVVTISPLIADQNAKVWDITSDQRDGRMLVKTIQFIYGFQLDKHGGHEPLPQDKMQSLFTELKSKYPADFSVTPEQARRWRLQQIADCCKEQNLPAALFHQNWLLAEAVQQAAQQKK